MRRGSEDRRGHCFEGVGFAIVATWLDLIDLCLVRKDLLLRAGLPLREQLPNTVNVGANKQPSPSVQLRSWQELRRGRVVSAFGEVLRIMPGALVASCRPTALKDN
jgi:hypothetical protein